MKLWIKCIVPAFALAVALNAQPFTPSGSGCQDTDEDAITAIDADGAGPGCSPVEGFNVGDLDADNDCFEGRIGATAVTGTNPAGQPADDLDGDGLTDSVEECWNDAFVGHCGDVDEDNTGEIDLDDNGSASPSKNWFDAHFVDLGVCAVTECSDQIDNDGDDDGIDYPNDPDCTSYSDGDEDQPGCQATNGGTCGGSLDS